MINYLLFNKSTAMIAALVAGMLTSCEKDVTAPALIADGDSKAAPRAIYGDRTVSFSYGGVNQTYTSTMVSNDFGNISGWDEAQAYISSDQCRIKLLANEIGNPGGVIAQIDISDGTEYEVTFDVKYHSSFQWGTGGKVGFGFKMGDGFTGCATATGGTGGSARLMWKTESGRTFFEPYVYHKDMAGPCGDTFNKTYPSSGSLSLGSWYTVKIYMKSNTGSNSNGAIKYFINGTTVHSDTSFRWTTDDSKRTIHSLMFHTFRGGSSTTWATSADGFVYYDNVVVNKIL
jgi:hypothetical protein